ncbi:MAG: dihydrofolate reductase family protein [Chitinophagales bacterium]
MSRKVILYIAASLDGYIAKSNDDLSFLNAVQREGEDYGYQEFMRSVDTVILGRKTYDWVMTQVEIFPHAELQTFVITSSKRENLGKITFYNGDIPELITNLKTRDGQNIFIDGGAAVVNTLLNHNLIDEIIVSIIPVLLGDGVRLFNNGRPEQAMQLLSSKQYESGLVQLHYQIGEN